MPHSNRNRVVLAIVIAFLVHGTVIGGWCYLDESLPGKDPGEHINPLIALMDYPGLWVFYQLLTKLGLDRSMGIEWTSFAAQLSSVIIGGGLQWSFLAWIAVDERLRDKPKESNAYRKCEYNPAGNTSGVCPECGTPIPVDPRKARFGTGERGLPNGRQYPE